MAQGVDAVIFDWGGTLAEYALVEFEELWRRSARHLAPDREVEAAMHLVAVEAAFWERTSTHQRSGTLAELLDEAASILGGEVGAAVREEAAAMYLEAWEPHIRHDPDAVPVLEALRERGLRIGLLSNTNWPRAFHERFLERDGLAPLIDARVYSSEIAYMKPHPEAFAAALEAVGVRDPARAVFVGDRPYDDIFGARQAGMRAVLRHNPLLATAAEGAVPGHDVEPDAAIDRLPQLLPHIEAWMGRQRHIVEGVEEYIRHGIGAVRPYLYGHESTLAVLEALGGSIEERMGGHVEVRIGDSMLVVEMRDDWPSTQVRQSVYVYVGDVDATYAAAVRAGATSVAEPLDKPYAERQCTLQDAYGNTWYVATYTGPHAP